MDRNVEKQMNIGEAKEKGAETTSWLHKLATLNPHSSFPIIDSNRYSIYQSLKNLLSEVSKELSNF